MDMFTDDLFEKLDPAYQRALDDGLPNLGPFAPLDSSFEAAARELRTPYPESYGPAGPSQPRQAHSSGETYRSQLSDCTALCNDYPYISNHGMSSQAKMHLAGRLREPEDRLSAVESLRKDLHNLHVSPFNSYAADAADPADPEEDRDDDQSAADPNDPESADEEPEAKRRVKGKGSRRRPKTSRKDTGTAWEFCRQLLHNPNTCPSLIRWEEPESGRFRLVDKDEVARLWGEVKGNKAMNYSKFSRTLRYQYKINTLKCEKRKLEYSFGENADGWRTDNPNFSLAPRDHLDENN